MKRVGGEPWAVTGFNYGSMPSTHKKIAGRGKEQRPEEATCPHCCGEFNNQEVSPEGGIIVP